LWGFKSAWSTHFYWSLILVGHTGTLSPRFKA